MTTAASTAKSSTSPKACLTRTYLLANERCRSSSLREASHQRVDLTAQVREGDRLENKRTRSARPPFASMTHDSSPVTTTTFAIVVSVPDSSRLSISKPSSPGMSRSAISNWGSFGRFRSGHQSRYRPGEAQLAIPLAEGQFVESSESWIVLCYEDAQRFSSITTRGSGLFRSVGNNRFRGRSAAFPVVLLRTCSTDSLEIRRMAPGVFQADKEPRSTQS